MSEHSNEEWCCGCCIGFAIGYLLFYDPCSHAMPVDVKKSGIEEKVSTKQDSLLLKQIDNYQKNISPKIKEKLGKDKLCKYEPSCSEYAKQAIEKYGSIKGSYLATKRLAKCNPLSKGGKDPVK